MKILHLPFNISGNPFGLCQGEKAIGLDSSMMCIGQNSYNFPSEIYIPSQKFMQIKLLKTFLEIRKKYDVFHFNYGSSLLNIKKYSCLDLPFYPNESRLFVTYQGCDARQKFPTIIRAKQNCKHSACEFDKCYDGICNSGEEDLRRKKKIEIMMKYCEHAFSVNPDLLHFLPQDKSSFLPYTISNFDLIKFQKIKFFESDMVTILHAPTQRVTKGTHFIIDAIEKLKDRYPNKIKLILVENLPYEQALKIYQQADLVIDQILIGWYGGFAVEVMKMGIPVASYINEDDLKFIPPKMTKDLPIININPKNIEIVLEKIIQNREILKELGLKSIEFVNKWHDPKYVASLTHEIYKKSKK